MSTLNSEQWQALGPYLDVALTLTGAARKAWLESLRSREPVIAGQLETLLKERDEAEMRGFLQRSPLPLSGDQSAGQAVGAYKLVTQIGRGGMGTVWLAERSDGRFEGRAAVKFLNMAVVGRGGEERFRREGAILARLSHAHVAKLLDAGVSGNGHPYLILEYVAGQPIDQYCDERGLNIEERIRLFLNVLDAVAHAHANLIVHRDIKPTNVLVSKDGQVKLLDFGIAKLLEGEGQGAAATLLTQEAGSALTPEYAAPEQITGAPVTTATDVYELGVLLYVLLTGQHPANSGQPSPAELLKSILETDPQRPSEVVVAGTKRAAENAERRGALPDTLRNKLRGDLDTVILKALKKNPAERYGSVSTLAGDLGRYLRNEPISARPDSVRYRATKFVRRHRLAVVLALLVVLATTGGAVGTWLQARKARQERDAALRERDRSTRITEFMTSMFKVSDPSEARGNSITAREILDKAAQQAETDLARDPEAQAHMMYVMGEVYDSMGLIAQGKALVSRAAELQRKVLGPSDPETLTSLSLLSVILLEEGNPAGAEKLQRETLAEQRRVLGAEHPDTVRSMSRLASIFSWQGRGPEAENLKREALVIQRRILGPDHPDTLRLTNSLVSVLWSQGDQSRYAEAEDLQRAALETERRVLGPEHPDTLNAMLNLGVVLRRRGKYAEAEKVYREALPIQNRVLGPEHADTLALRDMLATAVAKQGRYEEAEKLYYDNRALQRRLFGPESSYVANATYNLACLAAVQGKRGQALDLLGEALNHGLAPVTAQAMEQDEDLKSLHGDSRFAALIARARKLAAAQKSN